MAKGGVQQASSLRASLALAAVLLFAAPSVAAEAEEPVAPVRQDGVALAEGLVSSGGHDRTWVGIRDPETGYEGLLAHGWGLGFTARGQMHVACAAQGLPCQPVALTASATDAAHFVGPEATVQVTAAPAPSASGSGLHGTTVTISNLGTSTWQAPVYRGVWKFAAEPAPLDGDAMGRQLLDIWALHHTPSTLGYTSTHAHADTSPFTDPRKPAADYDDSCPGILAGPGNRSQGGNIDAFGPCSNGFLVEVDLPPMPPGSEVHLLLVHGTADTPVAAHKEMAQRAHAWAVAYADEEDAGAAAPAFAVGILAPPEPTAPTAAFQTSTTQPGSPPEGWHGDAACVGHVVHFEDRSRSSVKLVGRSWSFVEGGEAAVDGGTHATHTYYAPGTYPVALTVTDMLGQSASAKHYLDVLDCGKAPVPRFTVLRAEESCGSWAIGLVGLTSYDPDGGAIDAYQWLVGGQSFTGSSTSVMLGSLPVVNVALTVTDDEGEQATLERALTGPGPCAYDRIDADQDGVRDAADNCPFTANALQTDADGDLIGDACDASLDLAAVPVSLPIDSLGDAIDTDSDGLADEQDNCVVVPNRQQRDLDLDGIGDVCDADMDGDGVVQWDPDPEVYLDNCPTVSNPSQADGDGDGTGDACQEPVTTAAVPSKPAAAERFASQVGFEDRGASALLLTVAGAAAVAAAALVPRGWRRFAPALAIGFSRLTGSQVEEHPVRHRILQLLQEKPGLHFHAIVREVQKGRGTVRHHLDVLTRNGLVRAHAAKGFTAFYPRGVRVGNMEARTALQNPLAWRVLEAASDAPGASVSQLARAVGARHGTVHHHVQRLRELGLLEDQISGRARALYPSAQGLELLADEQAILA